MPARTVNHVADRWMEEQLFEEDVRAIVSLLRPNRQERMSGWQEYRTGGKHFRVTISWDDHFELASDGPSMRVPCMSEVLETILVGSATHQDDLTPAQEFELYREVIRDLSQRLDSLQACYE